MWIKFTSFNVWVRYFVWNFKGTLWNSTQNILLIHWKIRFLYNIGILRALRFKSSYAFLKRPPVLLDFICFYWHAFIYSRLILWPSDAMWWHTSGSNLTQVMAYCLKAPRRYLNQCRLIIKGVLWHSPESNSTGITRDVYSKNNFKITIS